MYKLSELIKENVDNGNLPKDILTDMEISLQFNPPTYYGIDKEFYYMTHNNSYEGFVHSEMVNAKINGVWEQVPYYTVEDNIEDQYNKVHDALIREISSLIGKEEE